MIIKDNEELKKQDSEDEPKLGKEVEKETPVVDTRIKGFGGSEQFTFADSRTELPFLIDPKAAVPIWKIISKVAGSDM